MALNNPIVGGIYSLEYSSWITNFKIYGLVLYGLGAKVHILNLSAVQLSTMQRIRLMRGIITMSKIQNDAISSNGRMLYRIFKTYYPREVSKCYRTLFNTFIVRSSLINYGLHKKEYYDNQPDSIRNNTMLLKAQRDMMMKMFNLFSRRGVEMQALQASLAVPKYVEKIQKDATEKKEGPVPIVPYKLEPQEKVEPAQPKETETPEDQEGNV
jgi:hypothetical protein